MKPSPQVAEHTPEPWYIGSDGLMLDAERSPHKNGIAWALTDGLSTPELFEEQRTNLRRIVACVNACAGLVDPPSAIALWKSEWMAVERVVAERDALRTALAVVLDKVDYTAGACSLTEMVGARLPNEVIKLARAALAKPEPKS